MIRIAAFQWTDADGLMPEADSAALRANLATMAAKGRAFTLRTDGRILAVMGVLAVHDQCGTAWALMAPGCWGHMGALTRIVRDYLDGLPFRRIDMLVRAEFAPGHRWATRLGFAREGLLRAWRPDGGDMVMHARIRGDNDG
ncbi:MAG: hypothetical protein WBL20_07740 [Sphingobium sp.]|uniref:hypothetical protein n=1 Tax=Sphingobium sp. TaxID=1912891 RepID=UPI003BB00BCD